MPAESHKDEPVNLDTRELTGLLNQLQTGDGQALSRVYQRISSRLKRMALREKNRLRVSAETTEIVDDAILQVMRSRSDASFSSREKFFSYAYRIIANLTLDVFRRQNAARRVPYSKLTSCQFVDQQRLTDNNASADRVALVELVDQLENVHPQAAIVFRRVALEQIPLADVSQQMGQSEQETMALWRTASAIVRKQLSRQ